LKPTIFFAAFLFAGASAAHAQTDAQSPQTDLATPLPSAPPRKPAGQMDFGPLIVTPTIALLNVGVDSNIQNTEGQLTSDFTMTVSPQIDVKYKAGRISGEARTYLNYVLYRTFSEFGGFSPQVALQLEYRVARRMSIFTDGQFVSSKERPSVEIDPRVRHVTSSAGGGFRIGLAPAVDVELSAHQSQTIYSDDALFRGVPLQKTLNQRLQTGSAVFAFRLTPYTTVKAGATLDNRLFLHSPERNAHGELYSFGAAFSPRAMISGEASVGYRALNTQSATNPSYRGVASDGRLTLNLGDVTGFMVGVGRDVMPSYELNYPYYVQTLLQAAIQQRLGKHFDVGPAFNAVTLDYRAFTNLPPAAAAALAGDNFVRNYSLSFGFLTNRFGRYAVYVDHWERSFQNSPTRSYSDNRVGFIITSTRWLNGGGSTMQGFLVNTPSL